MRRSLTNLLLSTMLATVAGFGSAVSTSAQDRKPAETTVTVKVTFSPEGLRTEDFREETIVHSDSVLQALGQLKFTDNDHFTDFDILEAATIKADGRRIDVPADRIFVMKGSAQGAALFNADTTTRVIPFADLGVGDRRILHARRREKRAPIHGVVDFTRIFPGLRNAATFDIEMDVPQGLQLYVDERGVRHDERAVPAGRRWTWHVTPPPPMPTEPFAVSPFDTAPHIFVSNFQSWAEFGKNYVSLVPDAAKPDAAVIAQAEKITEGLIDRREIARTLFDWTSRNIRYFNVVLGSGGWLPHAPGSILALRYGDCKDHATLLRAMLAAKGIDSEYVVVSLARVYTIPKIPASVFDHMIVYIPEFGLYLDPTDPTSTFDSLPVVLVDKPVVRFAKAGGIVDRTPLNRAANTRVVLTSEVTIDAAGKASGTSRTEANGVLAEDLRRMAQTIASQGEGEVARKAFAAQRASGTATFEAPSYSDHAPVFRLTSAFSFDKPLVSAKARAASIPTGPRLAVRPSSVLARMTDEGPLQPFACGAPRTYVEHLKVTWTAGARLMHTPPNVEVSGGMAAYHATYTVHGNTMTVDREFRHAPLNAYCESAALDEASDVIRAAEADYATPLLLRPASGTAPAAVEAGTHAQAD